MRKSHGYSIITGPEIRAIEEDFFVCSHCQKTTFVKPMCDPVELGGWCGPCHALICKDCVGKDCAPFMKKIEKAEAKAAITRNWGI